MVRKPILAVALLFAVPAFANNTRISPSHFAASQPQPVLRLMSDSEFATFLQNLDSDLVHAQLEMKKMDLKAVSLDPEESQELARSYERCLQSVENARDEIQKLSQKQTLKLDLFLLIDLNQLGRNLDLLGESMVNPATVNGSGGARKALTYAKAILSIDDSLATKISTFQHHFIAFTGVVDATLQQDDPDASQPQADK
jgi:hypothetical protein